MAELGYTGGDGRLAAFVPLNPALADAFQFDWSTEYAWPGGVAVVNSGNYLWIWWADAVLALGAALANLPIREACQTLSRATSTLALVNACTLARPRI